MQGDAPDVRSGFGFTGNVEDNATVISGPQISASYVPASFDHSCVRFYSMRTFDSGLDSPAFAISVDLGTVGSTVSNPVTWGVGLLREMPIAYTTLSGIPQQRAPYWKSQYKTPQDVVPSLLHDFCASVAYQVYRCLRSFKTTIVR